VPIELKRMTKQELIDHVDQIQERWQKAERRVEAANREREIAVNANNFAKDLLHDIALVCEVELRVKHAEPVVPNYVFDPETQASVPEETSPEVRLLREIHSITQKERR